MTDFYRGEPERRDEGGTEMTIKAVEDAIRQVRQQVKDFPLKSYRYR